MSVDADNFSAVMGIVLKAVLTLFLGIISYAFRDIHEDVTKVKTTVSEHTTQLAVLENNYKSVDKKLDKIIEKLERIK